jgi:hypothetical protein
VENEVHKVGHALNKYGGYICMAAHAFQPDIPVENVLRMYETAHDYTSWN